LNKALLLFFLIGVGLTAHCEDYVLSVFEATPRHNFQSLVTDVLPKACEELLNETKVASRVTKIASFSVDEMGRRDDLRRGMQIQGQKLEMFDQHTSDALYRILNDWQYNHGFTPQEIQSIFQLHQSLDRKRTKFVTVESPTSDTFASVRIFDSSKEMKYLSRIWGQETQARPSRSLPEIVFPGFSLSSALTENGIEPSERVWSLGLLNVTKGSDKLLNTVLAQTADLLDLHYNKRQFLNFGKTDAIGQEDVDITMYSSQRLSAFYQRVLGVKPLSDRQGEPLTQNSPNSDQNFHVFHIKGSDFIRRFLDIQFHEPLFASNRALRNQQLMLTEFRESITGQINRMSEDQKKKYSAGSAIEVFDKMRLIFQEFMSAGQIQHPQVQQHALYAAVAKFFILRDSIPDNFNDELANVETRAKILSILSGPLRALSQIAPRPGGPTFQQAGATMYLMMLDMFLYDPMTFFLNRSTPKISN
jgi:hypothetical protein